MFRNEKFLGFVHPYNLLEYFQNKEIDSNKTVETPVYKWIYQRIYPLLFCRLLSWKLKRGRSATPLSSKFELFC